MCAWAPIRLRTDRISHRDVQLVWQLREVGWSPGYNSRAGIVLVSLASLLVYFLDITPLLRFVAFPIIIASMIFLFDEWVFIVIQVNGCGSTKVALIFGILLAFKRDLPPVVGPFDGLCDICIDVRLLVAIEMVRVILVWPKMITQVVGGSRPCLVQSDIVLVFPDLDGATFAGSARGIHLPECGWLLQSGLMILSKTQLQTGADARGGRPKGGVDVRVVLGPSCLGSHVDAVARSNPKQGSRGVVATPPPPASVLEQTWGVAHIA